MANFTQTIIIKPGETFTLPPGASLTFVSDPAGVESTCGEPPITSYKCGYFIFVVNAGDDNHPFDSNNCNITNLYVGDFSFPINMHADGIPDGTAALPTLNAGIDQSLFSFMYVGHQLFARRHYVILYFRAADTYFDTMELEIDERDDTASPPSPLLMYSKPNEYPCNQYDFGF